MRLIQSFAFVSEQRSFICSMIPLEPLDKSSGAMVCLNDYYQTAQARVQTQLRQIRIPQTCSALANRQPS